MNFDKESKSRDFFWGGGEGEEGKEGVGWAGTGQAQKRKKSQQEPSRNYHKTT